MNGQPESTYVNQRGWDGAWGTSAGISADERLYSTFIHLAGLIWLVFPLGGILGPLILWQIKKRESEYLDDHGREAVNFHISMLLYTIGAAMLFLCGIGFILMPVFLVLAIVMPIVIAVKANRGEYVRYPMTIRFMAPKIGV